MKMRKKEMKITVLGNSLITISLASALLECTTANVVVISHSNLMEVDSIKLLTNRGVLNSIITTTKDENENLSMLNERMHKLGCRVAYVKSDDPQFNNIILNSSLVISCCRSGLYKYYVDKFNRMSIVDHYIPIISVDNDESVYKIAAEKNRNSHIGYYKGTIHSVVSKRVLDSNSMLYYGSGFVHLFLPDILSRDIIEITNLPISKEHARIKICSKEDMEYCNLIKRININMVHSIISGIALYNSVESNGLSIEETLMLPINKVLSYDAICNMMQDIVNECRRYYLSYYDLGYKKSNELDTSEFMKYLFSSDEEVVVRGMPIDNFANLEKHIDDLRFAMKALECTNSGLYKTVKCIKEYIENIRII